MKKYFIPYLIMLIFSVSSCDSEGGSGPEETNSPPSVPVPTSPTNQALCEDPELLFSWTASTDPDGDDVLYQIEISTSLDFSNPEQTGKTQSTSKLFTLEKGTLYYWRVLAIDNKNLASDYSEVFEFYTEGEAVQNYVPFRPSLNAPYKGSSFSSNSVNLEWTGNDLDGDELTYDLYFGTSENPGLNQEGITEPSYIMNNLSSGTYYWAIKAIDPSGNSSKSEIWNFTVN